MQTTARILGLAVALATVGCVARAPAPAPSVAEGEWAPSRIARVAAVAPPAPPRPTVFAATPGKFPLRFYEKLRARPIVAPLGAVDLWELRDHPRRYDIITIGSVPASEYRGSKELLDQLATTHGLTREKAAVLTSWVRSGGVVWVEFGVFVQGHEWVRRNGADRVPAPDLSGFTIFGHPTRPVSFRGRRTGAFAVEPVVSIVHNEQEHGAAADIRTLRVVQAELETVYPIIVPTPPAEAVVREGGRVYATVVPLGQGKIVSSVPFDASDVQSDGEKYRINLVEWLGGYPIPTFDPRLDADRLKD